MDTIMKNLFKALNRTANDGTSRKTNLKPVQGREVGEERKMAQCRAQLYSPRIWL